MDYCLSSNTYFALQSLPSAVKTTVKPSLSLLGFHRLVSSTPKPSSSHKLSGYRRALVAVVSASNCELNTPLEPKSSPGRFLSGVLQDDLSYFHVAVGEQLRKLADDRDGAIARMDLSFGSDEEGLHRRIAELREQECQIAVEDVIYLLVLYKFSEIRVHLVPRLCRCIYKGRLEIWPSKDWELESIYSFEVLEMIREHLSTVIGWRADSNVTDNWATTQIPRLQLCRVYVASILYGYFLKSASLRHCLESSLAEASCDLGITYRKPLPQPELWSCGLTNIAFGRISSAQSMSLGQESCSRGKKREKLRCYIMGFDPDTLQMCAKPKTKEVVNLIEKHSCALFGNEETSLIETNDMIMTSLSSLKRMVLEAVAFGSFLWDSEEYVERLYKLNEN